MKRLNPYCNGMKIEYSINNLNNKKNEVLILIVME